ncbi:MAG: hypothetical protein AABW51_00005 [Nanoarchaeota archaeon]
MGWKDLSYWLRGGILSGAIIPPILTLIYTALALDGGDYFIGVIVYYVAFFPIIDYLFSPNPLIVFLSLVVIYFIIGSLVGKLIYLFFKRNTNHNNSGLVP